MKKLFAVLALAFCSMLAHAQTTTMTTTQNGTYQKAIYVTLAATDENNQPGQVTLDNRVNGRGPIGAVTISSLDFTGSASGAFTGFTGNPDGSRKPFVGNGTYFGTGYTSTGEKFNIYGTFTYHAFFSTICQGRGCPTYGWHYSIDAGSVFAAGFPGQQL